MNQKTNNTVGFILAVIIVIAAIAVSLGGELLWLKIKSEVVASSFEDRIEVEVTDKK
jgi:hypothetical protein